MSPFADAFTRRPTVPRRGFVPAPRVFVVVGVVLAATTLPFVLPGGSSAGADRSAAREPAGAPRPAAVTSAATSATPAPGTVTSGPASGTPTSAASAPGGSGSAAGGGSGSGGSGSAAGGSGGSGSAAGGGTTTAAAPPAVAPPAPAKTTAKAAAPPIPGRAIVGVQSRLCLSAAAGKDGAALVIATCDGSAVQHWEALSDGTIRSVGLCMDAAWGGTDVFTVVQVAYCRGNSAQQWRLNTSNDLVSVNADKCADVIDRRTGNGSPVKLYWCNGQDNQKWFWR
ncbi:ricin-type beta-trefoil lectin domain protein [Dactylosporangium siamense]|uniref:Ricin B lectin domain-containing protein n=1 Tax=Dactylosporangium siamense TaxID=685454 RepID=A0A919U8Q3_9ACTN|nr:RICIN domain-containing protein [Dactylosporangium siamense]GIG42416.1 hypothetical protein Dsi01nite_004570 [Dactylosporangium siamense]